MKEQKVYVTANDEYASDIEKTINNSLEDGWQIVSVTAQHISTNVNATSTTRGGYLIVFERKIYKDKDEQ